MIKWRHEKIFSQGHAEGCDEAVFDLKSFYLFILLCFCFFPPLFLSQVFVVIFFPPVTWDLLILKGECVFRK